MEAAKNYESRRFGEGHPRSKLSDHEVDLMREMHEEHPLGHPEHLGIRRLAKIFELSRNAVSRILHYKARVTR